MSQNQNIILIGFMGVGKGTIARELSKSYEVYAIDTDDLIESLTNKRIKKIFANDGEKYFRDLEQQTANWLENSVKNSVISTGGGFFKVENLKSIGKVIYLKSSFEAIYDRIINHQNAKKKLAKRPLFQNVEEAKSLFNDRKISYEQVCDIDVNVEYRSAEDIAQEIANIVGLQEKIN